MTDNASDAETKKPATWVSYLPAVGVVIVFVLGIAAGWFVSSVPFRMHLQAQDRPRTLGALVKAYENGVEVRAAAYLDPKKAAADMDNYVWVPRNVPAPMVGVVSEPGEQITAPGFRGAAPTMPRDATKKRIILVGGSTAFSSGAPSLETTIGGYLQSELTNTSSVPVEVFTFANPGWASSHELAAINNVLLDYDPDVVVALSGVNDCYWSFTGKNPNWVRMHWGETYFRIIGSAVSLARRPEINDPTVVRDASLDLDESAQRLLRNADSARYALSRIGSRYLFVLQPQIFTNPEARTAREKKLASEVTAERARYFNDMYSRLRRGFRSNVQPGFAFLDLSTVFDTANRTEEVFLDSYHFGDRGNHAIAQALASQVTIELGL